jgi:hypothetical protein
MCISDTLMQQDAEVQYNPSLTHIASAGLFLVFHHILAAAISPEVILLHGPGIPTILYVFSV